MAVGDPDRHETWEFYDIETINRPAFNFGDAFFTTNGGFRICLLRWLAMVDSHNGCPFYQPLLWFELVCEAPVHFMMRLTLPINQGRLTLRFPLSIGAVKAFGPLQIQWECWKNEVTQDEP